MLIATLFLFSCKTQEVVIESNSESGLYNDVAYLADDELEGRELNRRIELLVAN